MAGWRDIKRSMRRDVHREMCVPALYLHAPGATPFPLTVRGPHNKRPLSVGDLAGASEGWAEREDTQPRLIFLRSELPEGFRQGATISIEPGEAYLLGPFLKPDDIIQAVEVMPLDETDAAGLPVHEAYSV